MRRKKRNKKDIKLKIELNYEYTNQRKAIAFANKFKRLAKKEEVQININFIKV